MKTKLILITLLMLSCSVFSQQSSDTDVIKLHVQKEQLTNREDSLVVVVGKLRAELRDNPLDKDKYVKQILKLEEEILATHDKLEQTISQLSIIMRSIPTHHNIIKKDSSYKLVRHEVANFVYNERLKELLNDEDYSILLHAQEKECKVVDLIDRYADNYKKLYLLNEEYKLAKNAKQGDSLITRYSLLQDINSKLATNVDEEWNKIYDDKMYLYNVILDKLNRHDLLSHIEQTTKSYQITKAEREGQFMSQQIDGYRLDKTLLLQYELIMSGVLSLNIAADSLRKIQSKHVSSFEFPFFEINERNFINYEEIKVGSNGRYNARNPIPKCVIYNRGTVYRILLGAYQKAQQPDIFKGVYPIAYATVESDPYCYFAGGFRTIEEAESAVAALRKEGFKRPEIAVWEDGVYRNIDKESEQNTFARYRLEISGVDELPENIRVAINNFAENKEIVKIASEKGSTFIVSSFDSKAHLERLVAIISENNKNLNLMISEINE